MFCYEDSPGAYPIIISPWPGLCQVHTHHGMCLGYEDGPGAGERGDPEGRPERQVPQDQGGKRTQDQVHRRQS